MSPAPALLLALLLGAPRTVAVVPFAKGAATPQYEGLGTALASMMVTDLSAAPGLQLVERARLGALLDELKLSRTAFIDPSSAQKLGRGLSAQLIVTGTFSVLKERFILDVRMIEVESGAILKAARADGKLEEFIAIEKEVVERLLDKLEVKLSRSDRRKLLIAAPTESALALASYGKGVEKSDQGKLEEARAAFAEALQADPDFAKASEALRDLAAMVEREGKKEQRRYKDQKERSLYGALERLSLGPKLSLVDLAIRQELLGRAGQHCLRYQELEQLLLRTKGKLEPFYAKLPGREHHDRYKAGEALMDERGKALGLVGPETFYGTRPGQLMWDAGNDLSSGPGLLLSRNLAPEKFHDSLMAILARCHPPAVQLQAVEAWQKRVKVWGFAKESLFTVHGEGPTTVTVQDSLDLYWAYLRSLYLGMDRRVRARTDAVLARHPEGDKDRRSILSRIQEVVQAGRTFERRRAARAGLEEPALLAAIKRAQEERFEGLCGALQRGQARQLEASWARYTQERAEHLKASRLDQVGGDLAPMILAGCFSGRPKAPQAILQMLEQGLKRRHPENLEDQSCAQRAEQLSAQLGRARTPGPNDAEHVALRVGLIQYQGLLESRCLLP